MKVNDILNLNCKNDEAKEILQKALRKIKPLSKYEEVSFEQLEKFVMKVVYKYDIILQYISISMMDKRLLFSISMKNKKGDWLGTVYGISMYEVFGKLSIKLYSMIRNERLKSNDS